jgi:hypothetical protein
VERMVVSVRLGYSGLSLAAFPWSTSFCSEQAVVVVVETRQPQPEPDSLAAVVVAAEVAHNRRFYFLQSTVPISSTFNWV